MYEDYDKISEEIIKMFPPSKIFKKQLSGFMPSDYFKVYAPDEFDINYVKSRASKIEQLLRKIFLVMMSK